MISAHLEWFCRKKHNVDGGKWAWPQKTLVSPKIKHLTEAKMTKLRRLAELKNEDKNYDGEANGKDL